MIRQHSSTSENSVTYNKTGNDNAIFHIMHVCFKMDNVTIMSGTRVSGARRLHPRGPSGDGEPGSRDNAILKHLMQSF